MTIQACGGHIRSDFNNANFKPLALGDTINWTAGARVEIQPRAANGRASGAASEAWASPAMASPKAYTLVEAQAMALAASTAAVAATLYTLHY